jgi:arylsulfatase A-like enzyme
MKGDRRSIAARLARRWLLLILAADVAGASACRRTTETARPPIAEGALRGSNVLLVTIDTLRADHVGAYGSTRGLTPTLDRLAREGWRFDVARAHVPLTLPSHATIMSGLYPPANGVRDNGAFRFDRTRPTLASTLGAAGYRTAAFIGSFVLDARFGLNAGFRLYDDRLNGSSANLDVVQRTAEQVLAPAYQWITTRPQHPIPSPESLVPDYWFAWVHLYDPHEPYTPPEPYRSRYAADPYSGEIAYADAALGAFLARLQAAHVLEHTLVVIASDHGESLGEHGERTHGLFAYESTLRVPLILWAPPTMNASVIEMPVRLVDVMPTVLDLVGVAAPGGLDGRSLRAVNHDDDPGSYFEALNANLARNWAPLHGFVRNGLKVIDLPIPELYDLSSDPGEIHNLYAAQRDRARDLESRLDRLIAGAHPSLPQAPIDADAEARLRSLGYVVGTVSKPAHSYTAADDPKRLVHLNTALDDAAAMWSRGEGQQAIETLRAVVRERPDLAIAYDRLAFMLHGIGRPGDAVAVLDAAAKAGHGDRTLLRSLGSMLRDAGDLTRAAAVLEALSKDNASDLQTADALGQTYARMNRPRDAERLFRLVIAASPNSGATWNNLGAVYLIDGRTDEAIDALTRAVALNPDLAAAHNGLGVALARAGHIDRAAAEWQRALELRPGYPDALSNLRRVGK